MAVDLIPSTQVAARVHARKSSASYNRVSRFADQPFATHLSRAQRPAEATHHVRRGETLSSVVRRHLESKGSRPSSQDVQTAVEQVARKNGLLNPDIIHPGQKLDLAPLESGPRFERTTDPSLTGIRLTPMSQRIDQVLEGREGAAAKAGPRAASVHAAPSQGAPETRRPLAPRSQTQAYEEAKRLQAARRDGVDLSTMIERILDPKVQRKHSASPWAKTLDGPARLSSAYGMRKDPFTGRPAFHHGVDLAAKRGTKIMPIADGTVTFSGYRGGYGNTVVVRHQDGTETIYSHAAKNLVHAGDQVSGATPIALVGSSGRSTGPHLHFEVRKNGRAIDPMPHLRGEVTIASAG